MSHNKLLFIGLPVLLLCALVSAGVYGILSIRNKVSKVPRVDVLIATRDLWAEERIEERDIEVASLPVSTPLQGCFAEKSPALGHKVILPVAKGNPICARDLTIEDEDTFTRLVMRAVLVPVSETVGPPRFVQRGTRVDVLLRLDTRGGREHTVRVLKNVCVIGSAKPGDSSVGLYQMAPVFVLLSPDDAQKLARLRPNGKIRLSVLHGFPGDGCL